MATPKTWAVAERKMYYFSPNAYFVACGKKEINFRVINVQNKALWLPIARKNS